MVKYMVITGNTEDEKYFILKKSGKELATRRCKIHIFNSSWEMEVMSIG